MTWNKEGAAMMAGLYRVFTSGEMAARKPLREVVKGVFPQKGVAVIYGEPEGGKSFVALDMAASVAEGREWFGHRVIRTPVVYLALEGAEGFGKRVAAWEAHNGRKMPATIHFITGERVQDSPEAEGFDLTNPANVTHLFMTARAAGAQGGVVIIDTLNRASVGVDENSSEGMGMIVQGMHHLQQLIDGLVVAIHHPGKDLNRGMRGHSSLLGSLDASLEVRHSNGVRSWVPGKNKDNGKAALQGFDLTVVDIGVDEDGDLVTSCVVTPVGVVEDPTKKPSPIGKLQRFVFSVLDILVTTKGDQFIEPLSNGAPTVLTEAALDACMESYPDKEKARRNRFRDAIMGMVERGVLGGTPDRIWFKV